MSSNSISAFREAKRKQEEEELKKKLEMRRKKMEEQKALLEEEEKKERELRESRKKMSAAEIEKQRKAELEAMAQKLELDRKKKLEEEIKKQEELEKKRAEEREVAMKAEVDALMSSSKKVGEIVTSPKKQQLLSPRHRTAPAAAKDEKATTEEVKRVPRPVKKISDEERARRLEKLNSEGALRAAEAAKAAEVPKLSRLKRAETIIFRQPLAAKKLVVDDRKMKEVPKPISAKLDEAMIFDMKGVPNPEMLKIHFLKEGRITIGAAKRLVNTIREESAKLPNILELPAPMVIVGDIHGQFYDLVNMMRKAGNPKEQPYLFLGDYVDRGMFNTEVVLYLFALKIAYPKTVFLLRGNHEGRQMTNHYNFRRECVRKYSEELYQDMMKCFDALPICAVVTGEYGKFFCTHGGLSPFIHTLEDINNLDRFQDVPTSGPFCDLLWSDPVEEKTFEDWQVYDLTRYRKIDFDSNPGRNLSFTYGYKFAKEFCEENNFVSIVRGHEVQKDGFMRHWFGKEDRKDPLVITVFSAPNYTDTHGNKGAYLNFTGTSYTIESFEHESHPFVLPNFQDGITFSLPFIAENTTKIFAQLVAMMSEEDEDGNDEIQQSIKKKLNFLLRTVAGYKLERIEREHELQETMAPAGENATFEQVTQADAKNEQAPSEIAAPKPAKPSLRGMMKRSTSTGAIKKFF